MKKKLFSLVMMCFMAFALVLSGCSPKALQDNPATDANVTSNGGMTVVKGDYLYYVNGYIDETNLTKDDNKSGKIEHAGIYRTKLSDGHVQKDNDGFLVNTERVVSKIVGFSNGGFYIIDDYIYYSTPYMKLDNKGNLQTSRVEFHRVNIDGTKDKSFYVTPAAEDDLDWTLYKINGTVYLATYADSKISIVNTDTGKAVANVENSTSYSFLYETEYKTGMDKSKELQNYIYYTRSIVADDNLSADYKGNVMCRVNIATGQTEDLEFSKDYTYTIKYATADNLYYLKANTKMSSSALKLLYKKPITSKYSNTQDVQLCNSEYDNYYICPFGDNLVIASNSNGTFMIENRVAKNVIDTQRTIVAVYGNYAYYMDSNKLYRFKVRDSFVDGLADVEEVTDIDTTYVMSNDHFIDFDNQRVYVYAEYTAEKGGTNYYLNYINDEKESKFVGKFESNHIPAKPKQDEKYGEDPDVKYIPHID